MIVGEISRDERVLVVVRHLEGRVEHVLYAVPHTFKVDGPIIALTATPNPACLFEDRPHAERIAFELEKWGLKATVRRVSIVTTVEDARPEA